MAFYVPDHDALFVHIPKCGGYFVEEVFKYFGIEFVPAKLETNSCLRHGRKTDYSPAGFTFCTLRNLDDWMRSYWFFMFGIREDVWQDGTNYPHNELGPPFPNWETWITEKRELCQNYLNEMSGDCDLVISSDSRESMAEGLSKLFQSWGCEITKEQVMAVPKVNETITKLELGGGTRNRGANWVNLDQCESADIHHDLNEFPLPFADDQISEVYSSHCLEHLLYPIKVLNEIARICKLGSEVEIRVPHFAGEMAMVTGHVGVISEQAIINMDEHFVKDSWTGPKRLKLVETKYGASVNLHKVKEECPQLVRGMTDIQIMKYIPGTCHELRFHFTVIENECYEA